MWTRGFFLRDRLFFVREARNPSVPSPLPFLPKLKCALSTPPTTPPCPLFIPPFSPPSPASLPPNPSPHPPLHRAAAASAAAAAADEITLISEDGEEHQISKKTAMMSALVATMTQDDSESKRVPLTSVKGSVLSKVVEFMKRHEHNKLPEIEKPLKSADLSALQPPLDQWDIDFVSCEQVSFLP